MSGCTSIFVIIALATFQVFEKPETGHQSV